MNTSVLTPAADYTALHQLARDCVNFTCPAELLEALAAAVNGLPHEAINDSDDFAIVARKVAELSDHPQLFNQATRQVERDADGLSWETPL